MPDWLEGKLEAVSEQVDNVLPNHLDGDVVYGGQVLDVDHLRRLHVAKVGDLVPEYVMS